MPVDYGFASHSIHAQTRFVGELDLKELQRKLDEMGISAGFREKQLVCPRGIEVSKTRDGAQLDGPLCAEYFEVRKALYGRFHVV